MGISEAIRNLAAKLHANKVKQPQEEQIDLGKGERIELGGDSNSQGCGTPIVAAREQICHKLLYPYEVNVVTVEVSLLCFSITAGKLAGDSTHGPWATGWGCLSRWVLSLSMDSVSLAGPV
jgi:hypothetical protein